MPRILELDNPLGGSVAVTYDQEYPWVYQGSPSDPCSSSYTGGNKRRPCDFYVAYDPHTNGGEWWHWNKYKVTKIVRETPHTESHWMTTEYEYSKPTWHYSDTPGYNSHTGSNSLTCNTQPCNHWNDFRGHAIVEVTDESDVTTEHRFYQGMNDDWEGTAGWDYSASITLSDSDTRTDYEWLAGRTAEMRVLDSSDDALSRDETEYEWFITAGTSPRGAYFVGPENIESWTYGTTTEKTIVDYYYDTKGRVTGFYERGSTATSADNRYTQTAWNGNESLWILNTPKFVKLWAGSGPGTPGDELEQTRFYYDGANTNSSTDPTVGLVTRHRVYTASGGAANNTYFEYDTYGRVDEVTDPEGGVTTHTYDSTYGYLASTTDPIGTTDLIVDPGTGAPLTVDDPNDNTTEFEYDDYNRLIEVWEPTEPTNGDPSWKFTYDTGSWPISVKTERRQSDSGDYLTKVDYYDEWGRLAQTQTPTNSTGERMVETRFFNDEGRVRWETPAPFLDTSGEPGDGYVDPIWTTSNPTMDLQDRYLYDEFGRATSVETIADDSAPNVIWSETWGYDAWETTHTDRDGSETTYTTNGYGLLATVEQKNGSSTYTTEYEYDKAQNLVEITDDANNVTTIEYDWAGRKTSIDDPDSGTWTYTYTGLNQIETQTDGEGDTLWFGYDTAGRLTERRVGSSTGTLLAEWVYDATGEKGLLDYSVSYTNDWEITVDPTSYDARNRIESQRWLIDDPAVSGVEHAYAMEWEYDEANHVTSITYPGDDSEGLGDSVDYTFDDHTGQPLTATRSDGFELARDAVYTDQGQPLELRLGATTDSDGVDREWQYYTDTLRNEFIFAGTGGAMTNEASLRFAYNLTGDVVQRNDFRNDQVECFTYDDLHRLVDAFTTDNIPGTAADCTNGYQGAYGSGPYDHTYGYDSVGNRTTVDSTTYTFGAGSAGPHALTSVGSTTFAYDDAGRQTSRTGPGLSQTLAWTPTGMAESVTEGSDVTGFFYTADDQRVLRVDPDGTQTIRLGDHFESVIEASTTVTTDHYWFAGERIGMNTDDGTTEDLYFVFTDRLGTASVFYNHTTGGTITRQWFDPWGAPRANTGTPPTEVGYTGQHTDPTGLMHYGARLYDPAYATFITPDTIVPNPANPQDLNRYAYVRNNPTTNTDPSGNQPYVPDAGAACTYVGCGGTPKSHFGSWHRFNDYQSKHSANFRAGFADFLADKVNIGLSFPIMGPIAFLNPFELLSVSAPYPEVGGFDAGYTGGVILERQS